MKKILYIAARAPRAGEVKTRLGAAIGHQAAADLYEGFLKDLEQRFSKASFPVCWYVTPGDWRDRPHREQGEGDWATRQGRLFEAAAARGEERVVLMASDSPQLEIAVIEKAFAELQRHELVLGPVTDGGYYLIGMRGWHDVFAGVRMTTPTAMQDICARAAALKLSVGFTHATFDVDEVADLEPLTAEVRTRADLTHTRAALSRIHKTVAA
jgi:rSAM/selenodomain-associated transferase 1